MPGGGETQGEAPGDDPEWEEMVLAYARQLPERVAALGQALAAARANGATAALEEPRRLAHRLYGTAGSYGLEAFSAVASHIEDALVGAEAGSALDAAAWDGIELELRALVELAESAGRGASSAGHRSSTHAD